MECHPTLALAVAASEHWAIYIDAVDVYDPWGNEPTNEELEAVYPEVDRILEARYGPLISPKL